MFRLVKDILLIPILIMVVLGIVLGYIINLIEPQRWKKSNTKSEYALRRSIFSAISAFFGEMGFLVENSTLSWAGMSIVMLIAILAFFGVMLLQAETTSKVLKYAEEEKLETDELPQK